MAKPLIFTISAAWDDEATVWTGHCDDIPAAAVAPTLDELLAKISAMTLDLLPGNYGVARGRAPYPNNSPTVISIPGGSSRTVPSLTMRVATTSPAPRAWWMTMRLSGSTMRQCWIDATRK
jgi:hypothetical protein